MMVGRKLADLPAGAASEPDLFGVSRRSRPRVRTLRLKESAAMSTPGCASSTKASTTRSCWRLQA